MQNTNTSNAVIYCRVSTTEQATEGESLSNQEKRCLEFADKKGYTVVEKFIEEGESGRRADRTQLTKMLACCTNKKNNISAVICLKADRFARNTLVAYDTENRLNKAKVKLLYVMETNGTTANDKFIRGFFNLMAENESNVNSERTIAGIKEALSNGRWLKQLKGYSFAKNNAGKSQLFKNEEAKHIKKIFELFNKGVYSQLEIIRIMKQEGFKISKQTLNKTLRNSVYCGLLLDKQNGNYIKGIHEPIITQDLFFSVQNLLTGKKPNIVPKLKNNPLFPLRQFIYCETCGSKLTASEAKSKTGKRVPYYHCNHKGARHFPKKAIETQYLEHIRKHKLPKDFLDLFEKIFVPKWNEKALDKNKIIEKAQRNIKALKEQKSKIIDFMAKEIITGEDGSEKINNINIEIHEKENLLVKDESMPNIKEFWGFFKFFINNLDKMWEEGELDMKQRLQSLITPFGFIFKNNLIQPLKMPYFLSSFASDVVKNLAEGG